MNVAFGNYRSLDPSPEKKMTSLIDIDGSATNHIDPCLGTLDYR